MSDTEQLKEEIAKLRAEAASAKAVAQMALEAWHRVRNDIDDILSFRGLLPQPFQKGFFFKLDD